MRDQRFAQFRIGAKVGDAIQIVVKLFLRVAFPIGDLGFFVGDVDQFAQIVDVIVGEAHHAARKAAVAAGFIRRGGFEHGDARAHVTRGQCGAVSGIAFADDDDIELFHGNSLLE